MSTTRLYTEEQVRKMLLQDDIFDIDDILDSETPIELPTGWVIKKEATTQMEEWSGSGCQEEIFAFIKGAEWIRDKILNK